MTHDDVLELLARIVAFEPRREIGDADITAWSLAARLGRWSLEEATEAVALYELTAEWPIKVSHVHRAIRNRRHDRLDRALTSPDPADRELLARVEAIADAKAVDAAPVVALPAAERDRARRRDRAADTVREAMAAGARARAAHAGRTESEAS